MKTIKVTGRGKLRVRPDMTRISVTLEGLWPDYGETLRRSSEDTEQLRALLEPFGFARTDLKTLSFNVDTEYEGYQENNVYKQRFVGYRFRHQLKLEFDSDNALLGKLLYALANCPVNPEFRISYTVRDSEKAKNELLGQAVRDARAKAEVLTCAAGVTLKELQTIDYSWGQLDLEVRPMNRALMAKAEAQADGAYALDIEPDDIEITDTVTVIWEIS